MAYPKEILSKARTQLDTLHEKMQGRTLRERDRVFSEVPQARTLEREILSTSARLSSALISRENVEQKVEEIKNFNLTKREELENLLVSNGFKADALDRKYHCNICNDTGIFKGSTCKCLKDVQRDLMYEKIGASSDINSTDFNNFDLKWYRNETTNGPSDFMVMKKHLQFCKEFAMTFSRDSASLLFMGDPGLGKTHLSLSIGKEAIIKGFDVIYLPFHEFLGNLESAKFGRSADSYQNYINPALSCELLILDDVGSEFNSTFAAAAIYEIVNTRLISHLPTIISTNLNSDGLTQRYGARTTSRLIGCYEPMYFKGQDIRIKKKYSR